MSEQVLPAAAAPPQTAAERAISKALGRLVPLCMIIYVIAFVDRTNIGFAALHMNSDLGLTSAMFGIANTVYYLSYLACQVPSNLVLEKLGAHRWIPIIMLVWGIVSAATILADGPYSLYTMRFLLGIAEAGIMPGILFYLGLWAPKKYRARANAIFLSALPVSLVIGSPLSATIMQMDGIWGLTGWRWLFIVEAAPAILLGIFAHSLLPARPKDASWLTAEEKTDLQRVLDEEKAAATKVTAKTKTIWKEMLSAKVLILSATYFCLAASLNMMAVWLPQIVKEVLGNSSELLVIGGISCIPPLASLIVMPFVTANSDRTGDRTWHSVALFAIGTLGWALTATATSPFLRLTGLSLAAIGTYCSFGIFFAMVSQLISHKGQAAGLGLVSALGLISTLISPIIVGTLKDMTNNFTAGLWYTATLFMLGCIFVYIVRPKKEDAVA